MKVIVTGSNGFVGRSVMPYLQEKAVAVEGVERRSRETNFPLHVVTDFEKTDWSNIIEGADAVIHLAARAHRMGEPQNAVTDELYLAANRDVTLALAEAAEHAGVKHFIFMSSIAAEPFDPRLPQDTKAQARWGIYGASKYQAEAGLLSRTGNMRISIIRPPLIYGPGVKGNMATLIKLAQKPYPLPFGCLTDKKSFLYVENLADAIYQLLVHTPFQDALFTLKDADLSLAELIAELRSCLGRRPNLITIPGIFYKMLFFMLGRRDLNAKLFGEQLVVDTKFTQLFKWSPPFTYKEGFKKMVDSCIVPRNI